MLTPVSLVFQYKQLLIIPVLSALSEHQGQ